MKTLKKLTNYDLKRDEREQNTSFIASDNVGSKISHYNYIALEGKYVNFELNDHLRIHARFCPKLSLHALLTDKSIL